MTTSYAIWITLPDRAKMLGVALSTLRLWIANGSHPRPVKFGSAVRLHGATIEEWDRAQALRAAS